MDICFLTTDILTTDIPNYLYVYPNYRNLLCILVFHLKAICNASYDI